MSKSTPRFTITITADIPLAEADIWPDGEEGAAPANPDAEVAAAALPTRAQILGVAHDYARHITAVTITDAGGRTVTIPYAELPFR